MFLDWIQSGLRIPVLDIRGPYGQFCEFETPALGFICQATGVSTKAALVRRAAGSLEVLGLGVRRMHPAIAPMLDYYAYMGGCDSISTKLGAEVTGTIPRGTMPRAFFVVIGDSRTAFELYHSEIEYDTPRIALVDTFSDDRHEAVTAAEVIGPSLQGVRLNLTREGLNTIPDLVRDVRRELDDKGFRHVKVYVSGGLDERSIPPLIEAGAEGFGVGNTISNAPTVNFVMDIVEMEGEAHDPFGRPGGIKEVFRCQRCHSMKVLPMIQAGRHNDPTVPTCRSCGEPMTMLTRKIMESGKRLRAPESATMKRERVLDEIGV